MTHKYHITGMSCIGCETTVKNGLLALPEVTEVEVSKDTETAVITMGKHIAVTDLQKAIGGEMVLPATKYEPRRILLA